MAVSPLWRGPVNIHGFVLDGKYYRQEWATSQTPSVPAVSILRIIAIAHSLNPLNFKPSSHQFVEVARPSF